jgi:hypothetical protein
MLSTYTILTILLKTISRVYTRYVPIANVIGWFHISVTPLLSLLLITDRRAWNLGRPFQGAYTFTPNVAPQRA